MKSSVFWDITPCRPLKVSRRFGGTCHLQLQGPSVNWARNHNETGSYMSSPRSYLLHVAGFYLRLFFYSEDVRDMFLRNVGRSRTLLESRKFWMVTRISVLLRRRCSSRCVVHGSWSGLQQCSLAWVCKVISCQNRCRSQPTLILNLWLIAICISSSDVRNSSKYE
jgi:hypothetical protein